MRKEQTELFKNKLETSNEQQEIIAKEEVLFNGITIFQPFDPLYILLEEMPIKRFKKQPN